MHEQYNLVRGITAEAVNQYFNHTINKIKLKSLEKWIKSHYPELVDLRKEDSVGNRVKLFDALLSEALFDGQAKRPNLAPKPISMLIGANVAGNHSIGALNSAKAQGAKMLREQQLKEFLIESLIWYRASLETKETTDERQLAS